MCLIFLTHFLFSCLYLPIQPIRTVYCLKNLNRNAFDIQEVPAGCKIFGVKTEKNQKKNLHGVFKWRTYPQLWDRDLLNFANVEKISIWRGRLHISHFYSVQIVKPFRLDFLLKMRK